MNKKPSIARQLLFNVKFAEQAVSDKTLMEALAFALMVKTRFVSSMLKSASANYISTTFGLGTSVSKRIVSELMQFGLANYDSHNHLVISKLTTPDVYAQFNFVMFVKNGELVMNSKRNSALKKTKKSVHKGRPTKEEKRKQRNSGTQSLEYFKNIITAIACANYLGCCQRLSDSLSSLNGGSFSSKKKRIYKRLGTMLPNLSQLINSEAQNNGISYATISNKLHCSVSKCVKIIDFLYRNHIISKKNKTDFHKTYVFSKSLSISEIKAKMNEIAPGKNFVFGRGKYENCVFITFANEYSVKKNKIVLSREKGVERPAPYKAA